MPQKLLFNTISFHRAKIKQVDRGTAMTDTSSARNTRCYSQEGSRDFPADLHMQVQLSSSVTQDNAQSVRDFLPPSDLPSSSRHHVIVPKRGIIEELSQRGLQSSPAVAPAHHGILLRPRVTGSPGVARVTPDWNQGCLVPASSGSGSWMTSALASLFRPTCTFFFTPLMSG